jgi:hypothetical protein
MLGIVVDQHKRVVDTRGRILWNHYGNDDYESTLMTECKLRLLGFAEWDIIRRYGLMYDLKHLISISHVATKTQWQNILNGRASTIDKNWFQDIISTSVNLPHNQTIIDRTRLLEGCLLPETLLEWKAIKYLPGTIQSIRNECENLLIMRQRLNKLLANVHESFDFTVVRVPFTFKHLFRRCKSYFNLDENSKVDMTPYDYSQFSGKLWDKLLKNKLVVSYNLTLKSLFMDWLSTKSLILKWKFGTQQLKWIGKEIVRILVRASTEAGFSSGVIAAQSVGG